MKLIVYHIGHKFIQEVRLCVTRNFSNKPKTGIVLLNMGGPQNTDQVHDYLNQIMTDRDMIQLPFAQEYNRDIKSFFIYQLL